MAHTHNLGYPRIGLKRELKHALEAYWSGDKGRDALEATGRELRQRHWQQQSETGLDRLPVGDFAWYDGVLEHSLMFGVIPERFGVTPAQADLDTAFRMARGRAPTGEDARPCEMTKWFNTNYHYIVPELDGDQSFSLNAERFLAQVDEALASGYRVKPVLLAPVTFLALAKPAREAFDKLGLLDRLLPVYQELLRALAARDIDWVQLDEPLLVTDLDQAWGDAIRRSHQALAGFGVNRLVTSYFGGLVDNRELALGLSKEGLHIDLAEDPDQLAPVAEGLRSGEILSAGVVNGRNVWCADLEGWLDALEPIHARLGDRLWLATSSSLLHVPLDVAVEDQLDDELRSWLAFARQKCQEIATLGRALSEGRTAIQSELEANRRALETRRRSGRTQDPAVRRRTQAIPETMARRSHPYAERAPAQHEHLNLPLFPTTTIGSFPQTSEIRKARRDHRAGRLSTEDYNAAMREAITYAVRQQEEAGLDVLVHGEAERNDMVEYFGELLDGFSFTRHGWVQSFGSRGVKPPIIHGDVSRPAPMTVGWSQYAASLTDRCVKGMLTGPVTILQWSFVRDDQPRSQTCEQIALALRDEVADLEEAGIEAIQVDEPAFREGLPLRRADWQAYLDWATRAFRLATSGVRDATQIHTHMCYAEFNDIIEAIAALDADVITIETSRSAMELLRAFEDFDYPNEIGPGVWDIHSPRLPSVDEMVDLLERAAELIPAERLWVNPDCGLKTRRWDEVMPALENMVAAARTMRERC